MGCFFVAYHQDLPSLDSRPLVILYTEGATSVNFPLPRSSAGVLMLQGRDCVEGDKERGRMIIFKGAKQNDTRGL